jgi:DNA-binding beta-propeller fold protein YncE
MMHTTGRSVLRRGPWALGNLALSFIAVAAIGGRAEAQPRPVVVVNTNLNTVTLIDTADPAEPATGVSFPVGAAPGAIVISRDGKRAYVANTGENSISVVSLVADPDGAFPPVQTIITNSRPSSLALSTNDTQDTLFVTDAGGFLERCSAAHPEAACTSRFIGGSSSARLAVNGNHVYIASDLIYDLDTAADSLTSFVADENPSADHANYPVDIAVLPNGSLYIAVYTYRFTFRGFSADGSVLVVKDPNLDTRIAQTIPLFSMPNSLALSTDGTRAFVGIQAYWADSLYGAAFMPGQWVVSIETGTGSIVEWTDLGADGVSFAAAHTPAALAVAPDRSAVFVSVPNIDAVLEISISDTGATSVARSFGFAGADPTGLAVVRPDVPPPPKAFAIEAFDDGPSAPLSAGSAALALASVLANDKVGGGPATTANVTLSVVSASPSLTLDTSTGAVWVGADAAPGAYDLTYRICEVGNAANCGQAVAHVAVRARFALHPTEDRASAYAGAVAIANVLANDLVDANPASFDLVSLSVATSDTGITLNGDGSVSIAAGTAPGIRTLAYRICDLTTEGNCEAANVIVTVVRRPIIAGPDSGSAPRTGGLAVANVLANDTLEASAPTIASVTLTSLSSSDPGVTLTAAGSVVVASGTAAGLQTLNYRICETASPDNCSEAAVSVTVRQNLIVAVGDSARASNKDASTPIKNVLANDSLGGAAATLANVKLSLVSTSNAKVRLNADGSVSVGDKAGSSATLVYQICEIAGPGNCAQATVSLTLSGKN